MEKSCPSTMGSNSNGSDVGGEELAGAGAERVGALPRGVALVQLVEQGLALLVVHGRLGGAREAEGGDERDDPDEQRHSGVSHMRPSRPEGAAATRWHGEE
jgi:hypothetical protein